MSEKTEVTQKTVGCRWHYHIEVEHREETGAKYPDKTVVKAGFSGHEDEYEDAVAMIVLAREKAKELVK